MSKELKVTLFLFLFAAILILLNSITLKVQFPSKIISPLSNGFSISSLFKKSDKDSKFIYGFMPYWNLSEVDNLQYDKLTDVAYFGLYLNSDGSFRKTGSDGGSDPGYNNWRNNPKVAEMIKDGKQYGVRYSLTVISHEDSTTDEFLNCQKCWSNMMNQTIVELNYHKIKDLHLNFEYSTYTDIDTSDKFTSFTKFANQELKSRIDGSLLVVSAFADSNKNQRLTNIRDLSQHVDAIFIMGYDFRTAGSNSAGPNAPLDGITKISDYDIRTTIRDYISAAPPNKLILGVPYYGYNWAVQKNEPYSYRIGAKISDDDQILGLNNQTVIPDNQRSMAQTYQDIMKLIEEKNIKPEWDDIAKVPFFTYYSEESNSLRQVYYEDKKSLEEKYKLVKENNVGGIGIWALGYDGEYVDLWNLLRSF